MQFIFLVIYVALSYSTHDSGNGLADTNKNMFPDVDSTWKVSFIFCIAWVLIELFMLASYYTI